MICALAAPLYGRSHLEGRLQGSRHSYGSLQRCPLHCRTAIAEAHTHRVGGGAVLLACQIAVCKGLQVACCRVEPQFRTQQILGPWFYLHN